LDIVYLDPRVGDGVYSQVLVLPQAAPHEMLTAFRSYGSQPWPVRLHFQHGRQELTHGPTIERRMSREHFVLAKEGQGVVRSTSKAILRGC